MKLIYLVLLLFLSAPVYSQGNLATDSFLVINEQEPIIDNVKRIGRIRVRDGFRTDCGYDSTLKIAKEKAAAIGGNILKINNLLPPDGKSTCYRIDATVYYTADRKLLQAEKQRKIWQYKVGTDSLIATLIPPDAPYALLYIYRPRSAYGWAVEYTMHINDSALGMVNNDSKFIARVSQEGPSKIWARTEARYQKELDIQHGNVYFIRCRVSTFAVLMLHPRFEMIPAYQGYKEYMETDAPREKRDLSIDDIYR